MPDRERREREGAAARAASARADTLRMNRARTQQLLQLTCDRRQRAALEKALADLDSELSTLEG